MGYGTRTSIESLLQTSKRDEKFSSLRDIMNNRLQSTTCKKNAQSIREIKQPKKCLKRINAMCETRHQNISGDIRLLSPDEQVNLSIQSVDRDK